MAPETDGLVVCHLDEGSDSLLYALKVLTAFSWSLSLRGIARNQRLCPLFTSFPEQMTSAFDICQVLEALSTYACVKETQMRDFLLVGMVSRRWVWLVGGIDAAAKKRANTSGVGKIINYCEDIYIPPYNNTH